MPYDPVDNFVTRNQMGWFDVSQQMMRTLPGSLLELMSKVIVVKAEPTYQNVNPFVRTTRFWAYSDLFDPLTEGALLPQYAICFSDNEPIKAIRQKADAERIAQLEEELADAKTASGGESEPLYTEVPVERGGQA